MNIKWLASTGLKLLIGLVAAATFLSCFGRWAWLLDLLTFARQHLLVAALMLSGIALALRCRRWAAVAVATAVVNVIMLVPAWSPSLGPATAATPSFTLRVVTLNVLLENHRSKAAVKFLRDSGADVYRGRGDQLVVGRPAGSTARHLPLHGTVGRGRKQLHLDL